METRITTQEFLGLQSTAEGDYRLTMTDQLLGGGAGSMFGGVGLASGIVAMEKTTDQSAVYLSCQFASTVVTPDELVINTEVLAHGRTVSQMRMTGTSGERTILALIGATGDRPESHRGQWRTMPVVAPPEDLEPLIRRGLPGDDDGDSLHHWVDVRMAHGSFGFAPVDAPGRGEHTRDENTLFWLRMPNVMHDAAALAIMADYLPSAVGNALGEHVFCSSLDNTIRFNGPFEPDPSCEWILAESHVEFVGDGFTSNRGLLWSRDGRLLASAAQSTTIANPR